MTNDRAPDNATGDSVTNAELIVRVHAFMAALLTFLGFNVLPTETAFGMLDTLTQWLADAKKIRRDPQGATARIWWDAFKDMWRDDEMTASDCAKNADAAAAEFGKRFLPVADDGRDTFDTADFEALRTECDRLDANIALLESRVDDLQQNLDAMVAERDALLKTNAHHASETESLRQERDALKTQLAGAIVPLPKPDRVTPGQRWAILYDVEGVDARTNHATMDGPQLYHRLDVMTHRASRYIYLGTEK